MGHLALDAYEKFRFRITEFTAGQLRLLLETKHLYQRVSLQPNELLAELAPPVPTADSLGHIGENENETFRGLASAFLDEGLTVSDKVVYDKRRPVRCLVIGNVKLFCAKCGGKEAFRPIWFEDVTNQIRLLYNQQRVAVTPSFKLSFVASFQHIVLVFQCQVCEGKPQAFLLRRDGADLYLEGRSPIEHVEIHPSLPKKEAKWFKDAIVAHHSGKTLAGLFYLRTFIEQFGRRMTRMLDIKETGDVILSAYSVTLLPKVRDSAPSLKEWYEKLSEAIHGAKEDAALFDAAKEKIEEHFEFRRLYKLDSETIPEKAG
ncbi:MAG: hypothetical protein ABSD53_09650 [Terriglobales bacterium]|jgi:hypothetical protein